MNLQSMRNKYILVGILFAIAFFSFGCGVKTHEIVDAAGNSLEIYRPLAGFSGIMDILVIPMAGLMWVLGKTVAFGNYAVVILLATIIVRSLAWPIYGKTNDMSLKMNLISGEQRKIEEKYKDRMDKESQQRKSMELMQLYKKYNISMAGCFMPFIQMPIFLAFFETLRRIPFTIASFFEQFPEGIEIAGKVITKDNLLFDFDFLQTKIFGIDLFKGVEDGGWQKYGIWVLAALVAGTQLLTQFLSQRRAKKQKEEMYSDVPDYRKPQQTEQQKSMNLTMNIMMYSMPLMMVIFIIQSPAALGWYWLVGNIYSALQSAISAKTSAKKLEKLRQKYGK